MDRAISQKFRRQLKQKLNAEFPSFEIDREAEVPGDCLVYRCNLRSDLHCFLMFLPHKWDDAFTIECAWSTKPDFPAYCSLKFPRDWPSHEIKKDDPWEGEFRFRIDKLWQPEEQWWALENSDAVDAIVQEMIDLIKTEAVPYFRDVVIE